MHAYLAHCLRPLLPAYPVALLPNPRGLFAWPPVATVRRLARRNQQFLQRVERRRQDLQPHHFLRGYAKGFSCAQGEAFERLYKNDKRARIIASYHFGDFIYGLNYLMAGIAARQARYFLTLTPFREATYSNIKLAFGPAAAGKSSELLLAETSMQSLGILLRRELCSLVMFCDLPPGFGERVSVNFLQRRLTFPKGPATLALTNRVPILPVLCCSTEQGQEIVCAAQIEPEDFRTLPRDVAIQRITQKLADFFAPHFQDFIYQWRYLSHLPEYFKDAQPEALHDVTAGQHKTPDSQSAGLQMESAARRSQQGA